jgi:hypothetical protein
MGLVLYRMLWVYGASVLQVVVGIWGLVLYRVLWVYEASVIQGVVGI